MKRTNKAIHSVTVTDKLTGELVCTSIGRSKTAEFFYPKNGTLSGPDRHSKLGIFERLMASNSTSALEWTTPTDQVVIIRQELLDRYPDKYRILNLVTREEVYTNNQVSLSKITSVSRVRMLAHVVANQPTVDIDGFLVKVIEDTTSWVIPKTYVDAERLLAETTAKFVFRVSKYRDVGNLSAHKECILGFYGHIAPEVLEREHIAAYGIEKIIQLFKSNIKNGDEFLSKTKLLSTIYNK